MCVYYPRKTSGTCAVPRHLLLPSLRAGGEATQGRLGPGVGAPGLLRRCAPRNDGGGGVLLAMMGGARPEAVQVAVTNRSSLPRVCWPSSTAPKPFACWYSAAEVKTMPRVTFVAPPSSSNETQASACLGPFSPQRSV